MEGGVDVVWSVPRLLPKRHSLQWCEQPALAGCDCPSRPGGSFWCLGLGFPRSRRLWFFVDGATRKRPDCRRTGVEEGKGSVFWFAEGVRRGWCSMPV